MEFLTSEGETWGIPGPTFLILFGIVCVMLLIAAGIHRGVLYRGSPIDAASLGPQQIAYLRGGETLALYTSLGGLRAASAIGVTDGALVQTGPMPPGVTPLDQAVHNAAGTRVRPRDLIAAHWVHHAMRNLRNGLKDAGLVTTAGTRFLARLVPTLMLGWLGIGVLRVLNGSRHGKPIGILIAVLIVWGLITLVHLFGAEKTTRTADSALARLHTDHTHLAPANAPAYATYGAAGAAMGVALFGAATLWAFDPGFAETADVQRGYAASDGSGGGGGGGGGGCGGGGGGGCGGGGCGGCGGCGG